MSKSASFLRTAPLLLMLSLMLMTAHYLPLYMTNGAPNTHYHSLNSFPVTQTVIENTHIRYFAGQMQGSQLQRRLIPEAAEAVSQVMATFPILMKPFKLFMGPPVLDHPVTLAYTVLQFIFAFASFWFIYRLARELLGYGALVSAFLVTLYAVYETFCLASFTTARWTDIAVPGLLAASILFYSSGQSLSFLLTIALFALVRENVIFIFPFVAFLWFFSGREKKLPITWNTLAATVATVVLIRLYLYWNIQGMAGNYSDYGKDLSVTFIKGLQVNLGHILSIAIPLIMYNFLLIGAGLQWKKRTPQAKALVCTAVTSVAINLCFGSMGESYGRDLPALMLLILGSADVILKVLNVEEPLQLVVKDQGGEVEGRGRPIWQST